MSAYFPVLVDVVNMNQDAPGNAGNFNSNNGYRFSLLGFGLALELGIFDRT